MIYAVGCPVLWRPSLGENPLKQILSYQDFTKFLDGTFGGFELLNKSKKCIAPSSNLSIFRSKLIL